MGRGCVPGGYRAFRPMLFRYSSAAHSCSPGSGPLRVSSCLRALTAWACLAFLASSFALAQDGTGGAAPPAESDQKFTVTGTVVNAATDEPIPRALVTMQSSPQRSAFTDGNGSFSIDGVPAGRFPVHAQKPGYFGSQESGSVRSVVMVDVGANSGSITIKLAAENIIFGRLTDANGQPIESVGVRLTSRILRNGTWHMESRSSAMTDEDGEYRFPNLQPGTYYVSAGPDVQRREELFAAPEIPRTGWPGVYFPQAPDLASAAPIQLKSGQKVEADMVMNRVPLRTVSGMVTGFIPDSGVSLQVQNSSGDFVNAEVRLQHDTGAFEIRLPAGNYRLKAFSQVGAQQMRADARITVDKDLAQLQLPLQPAVSMPIHVRMEDRSSDTAQSARSRAYLSARDANNAPPVSVHLVSTEMGGSDVYSVNGGAQGNRTLSLRAVEPGRYKADIAAYGGWYVESAQCGNTNLLTEDLVVGAGNSCTVELSLRNDGGTLSAKVNSATTGSGMALLVPARGRGTPRTLPFYTSDGSKAAHIGASGIAPGEYLLYAFDTPEGVEYGDTEVLRSYASQATPVTISPGQTTEVTTQIIETGTDSE